MGRKKEHVASKSFTIGLKELAFLSEEADRLDIKQSKLLTKYIKTIMLEHIDKEKLEHGPITWFMANKSKIIGTLGAAAIGKFVAKGFSTGTIAKLGPVRVKL